MPHSTISRSDAPAESAGVQGPSPDTVLSSAGRIAPLDGIRAFAVLVVLCYHFGISWVGGGLLGVDVFFVLSGYLITSLLCREFQRQDTIRLGRFWAQRARRLLPALFVLLVGIALYAHFFATSIDVGALRTDALATLAYVSNWHFILSDQGYFVQNAAPSPLLHTWSLAVEEQYYLIWPLVALFVARRWGTAKLAVVAGLGALGSVALMVTLYAAGASVDRIYYGTDTRAQALLVGSFLGAISARAPGASVLPVRWRSSRNARVAWQLLGLAGAAFLLWAWHALDGTDPLLYRGGFFVVALATGIVLVTCVSFPDSLIARCCSLSPLVFVGRISYGLYLYHWPLYLVIDHARTGLTGLPLLAARLAATFAVATTSFFLFEEPIRTGRWFRGTIGALGIGVGTAVVASALVAVTVAPATVGAAPSAASPGRPTTPAVPAAVRSHPYRFVLFGDSVATTLGDGLSIDSVRRYGVDVIDLGTLGCDLDNVPVLLSGKVGPATPGCVAWRSAWTAQVNAERPDVVGLLVGRWEVSDHLAGGNWVHVGEPAWNAHLASELDQAIRIFEAHGARVVLFTMPYVDPPVEAPDGTPYSENDPARITAFNSLLRTVAARSRPVVTVIDLNHLLDPSGRFAPAIGGTTVRWTDGIHITVAGGQLVQPAVFPTIAALASPLRRS